MWQIQTYLANTFLIKYIGKSGSKMIEDQRARSMQTGLNLSHQQNKPSYPLGCQGSHIDFYRRSNQIVTILSDGASSRQNCHLTIQFLSRLADGCSISGRNHQTAVKQPFICYWVIQN